jgi:hypothetical protein
LQAPIASGRRERIASIDSEFSRVKANKNSEAALRKKTYSGKIVVC